MESVSQRPKEASGVVSVHTQWRERQKSQHLKAGESGPLPCCRWSKFAILPFSCIDALDRWSGAHRPHPPTAQATDSDANLCWKHSLGYTQHNVCQLSGHLSSL